MKTEKTQLKRRIDETGITVKALSKRFGINYNHLTQCVSGRRNLSVHKEQEIMKFLREIPS